MSAAAEIEAIRAQYRRQKKLEAFVLARPLCRPGTKKWQVAAEFAALPLLSAAAVFAALLSPLPAAWRAAVCAAGLAAVAEGYLRFCLVQAVRCYQHYAAEETRRRCKCVPSCSEYAVLAFCRVFPLLLAVLKIRRRLLRTCNGEEYKVDFPSRRMGERFEREL